jgi:hypothetical protein
MIVSDAPVIETLRLREVHDAHGRRRSRVAHEVDRGLLLIAKADPHELV